MVNDREQHDACTRRFIELANEMKDDGIDINLVSAALMAASGVYVTYVAAGNDGGLEPAGVDKVVALFRRNLEHIQQRKAAELESGGD